MQRYVCLSAVLVLACAHSDPFVPATSVSGPADSGANAQLTFNPDQDYWPSWTQDGRGILYAFVDLAHPLHRCIGLLPPQGGTRRWELCDNRAVRADSLSSYEAFALDSTGRLLVAEAVSRRSSVGSSLPYTTLWLSDTAHPYVRTSLLTLPVRTDNLQVTWLADIQWTGRTSFLALGQLEGLTAGDSIFAQSGSVLRGTISDGAATLASIAGTDSATSYSLANDGATLVFTVAHDTRLFTVPLTGGVPVPDRIRRSGPDTVQTLPAEPTGVSCAGSVCIVARDSVTVFGTYFDLADGRCSATPCQRFGSRRANGGATLRRISLTTGSDEVLAMACATYQTPKVSPIGSDVVVQCGGNWGHLQTTGLRGSDLRLIKGALH